MPCAERTAALVPVPGPVLDDGDYTPLDLSSPDPPHQPQHQFGKTVISAIKAEKTYRGHSEPPIKPPFFSLPNLIPMGFRAEVSPDVFLCWADLGSSCFLEGEGGWVRKRRNRQVTSCELAVELAFGLWGLRGEVDGDVVRHARFRVADGS